MDILKRARELISEPEKWLQGYYSDGAICDPETDCFCVIGAVDRAVIESLGIELFHDDNHAIAAAESSDEGKAAIVRLQQFVPVGLVSDFNDEPTTTHGDVLALLDRAIAA